MYRINISKPWVSQNEMKIVSYCLMLEKVLVFCGFLICIIWKKLRLNFLKCKICKYKKSNVEVMLWVLVAESSLVIILSFIIEY